MAYFRKRNGKWKVEINKPNFPRLSKTFLDKANARKWSRDVESRMDRNMWEDFSNAESTTLKDLIIKYRDEIVPTHKAARSTTSKLNLLLRFKVVHLGLLQLRSHNVYKFKKEISEGRAPKTVNIYLQLLKQIWNTAKKEWSISLPAESPFALVSLNKVHNQREVILTDEEYNRLLAVAEQSKLNNLKDLIQFAYMTGARLNEIMFLKRQDVDFNKKLCTFVDVKSHLDHREDRTIPIDESVISILKKHPFGEYFFKVDENKFRFYFNQARRRAKLEHFRFHDLRSCFCSNCISNGVSIPETARLSGHRDWKVLKRYVRLNKQYLDKIRDKVEAINIVNFKK
jgi:integrase